LPHALTTSLGPAGTSRQKQFSGGPDSVLCLAARPALSPPAILLFCTSFFCWVFPLFFLSSPFQRPFFYLVARAICPSSATTFPTGGRTYYWLLVPTFASPVPFFWSGKCSGPVAFCLGPTIPCHRSVVIECPSPPPFGLCLLFPSLVRVRQSCVAFDYFTPSAFPG